jgi:nitrous oxidase accessory protein NosD
MRDTLSLKQDGDRLWITGYILVWCLGLLLLCVSCSSGGSDTLGTPPSTHLETQAIGQVLDLYRTAMVQEDIDRLSELLQLGSAVAQSQALSQQVAPQPAADQRTVDAPTFLTTVSAMFRTRTITALEQQEITIAADRRSTSFLEVESTINPATLEQQTRVMRTTLQLTSETTGDIVTFRISGVQQTLLATVTTPGQVQAGALTRISVTGTGTLASVGIEVPETGVQQTLNVHGTSFHGLFTPPSQPDPQPLRVRLQGQQGEMLAFDHRYRLRVPGEGVVQKLAGTTGTTRFFAVVVGPDGAVWGGGLDSPQGGGTLYQVPAGATTAHPVEPPLDDLGERVEDLAFDHLGRLHAIVFAKGSEAFPADSRDVVLDRGTSCSTANVFDPNQHYPLQVPDFLTGLLVPSPSTRVAAAGGGDIWLFGSDGGVARVADTFREGVCPAEGVTVHYAPVFRRDTSGLLTNVVPAFVVGADGALWFGTALGLTRFRDGQFTPVLFNRTPIVSDNVTTLEQFFQALAAAIFEARPLTTAAIGDVSFVDAFRQALVKEDLIFSAVEDAQGRLWVGTLGGGVRRIETRAGQPQDTLHLTQQDGLSSNLILALAVAPDGALWVATPKGVSRLQERGDGLDMIHFSALDGLALPVRDVAVDAQGTAWLATDGGLFRILPQGGLVRGRVLDATSRPVAGVDIMVQGTPFRTVTDTAGDFVLANLPPGRYVFQVDGQLATEGPFSQVFLPNIDVSVGEHTLEPVALPRAASVMLVAPNGTEYPPGKVGQPLPRPLLVEVRDSASGGLGGVPVTFTITAGRGTLASSLSQLITSTDVQGRASALLTLDTHAGTNQVTVTVPGSAQPLTFTAIGQPDREHARLLRISGNNQRAQAGEVLPEPLVVRLEDQFQNPIGGERIAAEIRRGNALFIQTGGDTAEMPTNAQGEASFNVRVSTGEQDEDVVVRVAAGAQAVQFLTIVGTVDTPDAPLDVAVTGNIVYIADRRSGLRVVDVSGPAQPVDITMGRGPLPRDGFTVRLALAENRVYVVTERPYRLYVLDITQPTIPSVLGSIELPEAIRGHLIVGMRVQEGLAYVATLDRVENLGTLQVVDISNPTQLQLRGSLDGLRGGPLALAVAGHVVYVTTDRSALLILDVSDPTHPILAGTFGEAAPTQAVELRISSGITVTGDRAYVVETRCDPQCDLATVRRENRFTVLDLTTPLTPRRRGTVRVRDEVPIAVFSPIVVAGRFAYLGESAAGLQAIDISDSDAPLLVGRIDTPSQALNVVTVGSLLYVTDLIFGLQVIQGPTDIVDMDGDGVIDFFDVFPTNPAEYRDTDGDGVGDNTDADADNDGFTNAEEVQADPHTDPLDPQSYPLTLPPEGTTVVVVDAASQSPTRARNGTPQTPYRSITEGLRAVREALRAGRPITTLFVQAGTYSSQTTQESFPLNLWGLSYFTMQGAGRNTTVIDAGFAGVVIVLAFSTETTLEGFTLLHGADGLVINEGQEVTLRQNQIADHIFSGITLAFNGSAEISQNIVARNGEFGIGLGAHTMAAIRENLISDSEHGFGIALSGDSTAEITGNTIVRNGVNGLDIRDHSTATVQSNTIQEYGCVGIFIDLNSTAEITGNTIVQGNTIQEPECVGVGIFIDLNSTAEITGNTIISNRLEGISVQHASRAMIADNMLTDHGSSAIAGLDSTVEVTGNTILRNQSDGIGIFHSAGSSTAIITANVIRANTGNGITIADGAFAAITSSTITQNRQHGIALRGTSTADIGLQGDAITIARNGGAGIFITNDGSLAHIDRTRIVFDRNAGGEIIGPFQASP